MHSETVAMKTTNATSSGLTAEKSPFCLKNKSYLSLEKLCEDSHIPFAFCACALATRKSSTYVKPLRGFLGWQKLAFTQRPTLLEPLPPRRHQFAKP
ncbi:hypothetical protein V5799_002901 [Amblyomma americanum]|uniref:Uncharacterized protein n=1 Tax=Amblyomma americanum TaxID=6943 RepID=A0AAQ4DAH8_AMBAM